MAPESAPQYPNSIPIDASTYDSTLDGLSPPLQVRVHRNAALADRGALRAQRDWRRLFSSLPTGFTGGAMGPQYNFVATWMPETLPDRLELVAYLVEAAFLVDDVVDAAESPMVVGARYMPEMLQTYKIVMAGGEGVDESAYSPAAKVAVGLGREMLAVDAPRAREAFRWFGEWVKLMVVRSGGGKEFADFEEYLEYRRINVSSQAAFGLFMFAHALTIPEDQQQACLELSQTFWLQLSLANDLESWERENQTAIENNQDSVTNGIWVLMNKHAMTFDEAKRVCRERAHQYAAEFLEVVEAVKARDGLCQDAKRFFDVLTLGVSGNVVWGMQCLRYHADQQLTPAQLSMARVVEADEATVKDIDVESEGVNTDGPTHEKTAVETIEAVLDTATHTEAKATREVPALDIVALEAPSRYLDSLPGKGIRDMTIDALNIWFRVPAAEIASIKRAVHLLHGASLMLDDIEDSSQLRRGKPATHIVFGQMQTINSAGYRFMGALNEVRKLDSEKCMDIFCDELRDLYTGQSYDISWTCNLACPTEDEYLAMVDNTGLFRMLARLLDAKSDAPGKPDVTLLTRFMTLLGRLFQIRDDYMNLTSADYTKQKGFCEDLDEGKYSLPLIHALGRCEQSKTLKSEAQDVILLHNLLAQRHVTGKMSLDQKKLFLEQLKARGSLEYTRQALSELQAELKDLGEQMGMLRNESLRGLLEALKV